MFDIGATELLVIVIVAILVIGPKDMPAALRHAGRWVGKIRRTSAHFRAGFDAMVREAEMEDMEKEWKERNAKIMAQTPSGEMGPIGQSAENADYTNGSADALGKDGADTEASQSEKTAIKDADADATSGGKDPSRNPDDSKQA